MSQMAAFKPSEHTGDAAIRVAAETINVAMDVSEVSAGSSARVSNIDPAVVFFCVADAYQAVDLDCPVFRQKKTRKTGASGHLVELNPPQLVRPPGEGAWRHVPVADPDMSDRFRVWTLTTEKEQTCYISFPGAGPSSFVGGLWSLFEGLGYTMESLNAQISGSISGNSVWVHAGTQTAYFRVRDSLHATLDHVAANHDITQFVFCGHGQGGGIATLAAVDIGQPRVLHEDNVVPSRNLALWTIGAPHVGCRNFADLCAARVGGSRNIMRFTNANDPLPLVLGQTSSSLRNHQPDILPAPYAQVGEAHCFGAPWTSILANVTQTMTDDSALQDMMTAEKDRLVDENSCDAYYFNFFDGVVDPTKELVTGLEGPAGYLARAGARKLNNFDPDGPAVSAPSAAKVRLGNLALRAVSVAVETYNTHQLKRIRGTLAHQSSQIDRIVTELQSFHEYKAMMEVLVEKLDEAQAQQGAIQSSVDLLQAESEMDKIDEWIGHRCCLQTRIFERNFSATAGIDAALGPVASLNDSRAGPLTLLKRKIKGELTRGASAMDAALLVADLWRTEGWGLLTLVHNHTMVVTELKSSVDTESTLGGEIHRRQTAIKDHLTRLSSAAARLRHEVLPWLGAAIMNSKGVGGDGGPKRQLLNSVVKCLFVFDAEVARLAAASAMHHTNEATDTAIALTDDPTAALQMWYGGLVEPVALDFALAELSACTDCAAELAPSTNPPTNLQDPTCHLYRAAAVCSPTELLHLILSLDEIPTDTKDTKAPGRWGLLMRLRLIADQGELIGVLGSSQTLQLASAIATMPPTIRLIDVTPCADEDFADVEYGAIISALAGANYELTSHSNNSRMLWTLKTSDGKDRPYVVVDLHHQLDGADWAHLGRILAGSCSMVKNIDIHDQPVDYSLYQAIVEAMVAPGATLKATNPDGHMLWHGEGSVVGINPGIPIDSNVWEPLVTAFLATTTAFVDVNLHSTGISKTPLVTATEGIIAACARAEAKLEELETPGRMIWRSLGHGAVQIETALTMDGTVLDHILGLLQCDTTIRTTRTEIPTQINLASAADSARMSQPVTYKMVLRGMHNFACLVFHDAHGNTVWRRAEHDLAVTLDIVMDDTAAQDCAHVLVSSESLIEQIDLSDVNSNITASGYGKIVDIFVRAQCVLTAHDANGSMVWANGSLGNRQVAITVGTPLTDIGVTHLAPVLGSPQSLITSLNLSGNQIGPEGALTLAPILASRNTTLTEIDLSGNRFGETGYCHFVDAMLDVPDVSEDRPIMHQHDACGTMTWKYGDHSMRIILDGVVGDTAVEKLVEIVIRERTCQTSFDLVDCYFCDAGYCAIVNQMTSAGAELVSHNNIGDTTWRLGAQEIKFIINAVTGEASYCCVVEAMVRTGFTLEEHDLDANMIWRGPADQLVQIPMGVRVGDVGVRFLAPVLASASSTISKIEFRHFSSGGVRSEGYAALVASMNQAGAILKWHDNSGSMQWTGGSLGQRTLAIELNTPIEDSGAVALANLIAGPQCSVSDFDLFGNSITSDGYGALIATLANSGAVLVEHTADSTMTWRFAGAQPRPDVVLHKVCNLIGDIGIAYLAPILANPLCILTTVDLRTHYLTDEGFAEIVRSMCRESAWTLASVTQNGCMKWQHQRRSLDIELDFADGVGDLGATELAFTIGSGCVSASLDVLNLGAATTGSGYCGVLESFQKTKAVLVDHQVNGRMQWAYAKQGQPCTIHVIMDVVLGDDEVKALAKVLAANPHIVEEINLQETAMTVEGYSALVSALAPPTFEELKVQIRKNRRGVLLAGSSGNRTTLKVVVKSEFQDTPLTRNLLRNNKK
eukprot:m.13048 g.13048  ORF g.13048 m.13048 type:complete len:1829 (-) comp4613_c0_seq1:54-5540(-)